MNVPDWLQLLVSLPLLIASIPVVIITHSLLLGLLMVGWGSLFYLLVRKLQTKQQVIEDT